MRSNRELKLKDSENEKKYRTRGWLEIAALILVFAVCTGLLVYINDGSSDWRGILNSIKRKFVSTNSSSISSIQIEPGEKSLYLPYKSGMVCVNANGIKYYNIQGREEWREQKSFGNTIVKTAGKYLLVCDELLKTLYLYNGNNMLWEKAVEGEIITASVNEKGFAGIIYKGSKSKMVVEVFDTKGINKVNRYYSSNYAVDVQISPDNKNIVIGEMDVNGLKVSTGVGFVPVGTELYSSFFEEGSVFASMNYIGKELILVLDDKILNIQPDGSKKIIRQFLPGQVTSVDGGNNRYIVLVEKTNKFLNAANKIEIIDTKGKEIGTCEVSGRVIDVDSDKDVISVNLGDRVTFLNSSGKEISRFNPKKEVRQVKLFQDGNHAAVIYPDRVDIVNIY